MKKSVYKLVGAIFILAFFFAAPVVASDNYTSAGLAPEFLEVIGGSMGGSWHVVAADIAMLLQENIPGHIFSGAPGGGTANPTTIQNMDALLGLLFTGVAFEAYQGIGDYAEAHSNLRHIISLYSMPLVWVTLRDNTDITSIRDLKDKRISPGRPGQAGLVVGEASLVAHGIDIDMIIPNGGMVHLIGETERFNMLRDRNLDAASALLPLDHADLQSLSITPGIRLISLEPAAIPSMQEMVPGLEAIRIEPGTFDAYQTEPVYTVAIITALGAHKDLCEDLVFQITQVVHEAHERLNRFVSSDDNVILTNPLAGRDENFPIHPGALRFYREIGLIQ